MDSWLFCLVNSIVLEYMNTTKKFLFVMDPLETLNLETETSLVLMQELVERGQGVY